MTQKLKWIARFVTLSVVLMLSGCEKDLYDDIITDGNVKITKININDPKVLSNKNLHTIINDVNLKYLNSKNNRMVFDSVNNFYFDDQNGVLIEKQNGYKSYTFPILRSFQTSYVENIVYTTLDNVNFNSKIIKYNLTENEKLQIENNDFSNLQNILENSNVTSTSKEVLCWFVHSTPVSWNDLGQVTESYFWFEYFLCDVTGSEGDGTDPEVDDSSGSEGSGSLDIGSGTSGLNEALDSSGGISTAILLPKGGIGDNDILDPIDDPCDKLKKILDTPTTLPAGKKSIKAAIIELNNRQFLTDKEEGYNFVYNPITNQYYAQESMQLENNMVRYQFQNYNFGGAHFHQDGLEPMFSHDDIANLQIFNSHFNLPNNASNPNYQIPMHLMTSEFGTYAITIENEELFSSQITEIYGNPKKRDKFRKNLEKKYFKHFIPFTSTYTGTQANYEEDFLRFITNVDNNNESYNLGISLYRAKPNLSGWEKLTIAKNGNNYTITATDCN